MRGGGLLRERVEGGGLLRERVERWGLLREVMKSRMKGKKL